MKNILFILIIHICSLGHLMAQHIMGKVVDENSNPLPYVSVVLQTVSDSSYIDGVATDKNGVFKLPVQEGVKYSLNISYVGYETISKICQTGDLGVFILKEDANILKEVNVIASRIRHDAGGYAIDLRGSDIVKGKQSDEALLFLPGISKEGGSFKINGLIVSEIYLDGVKLPNFSELDKLPADMIDKIKVNYLAGSNQNAALTGGTIDITLRKPSQNCYYGSLSGGATVHPSYGFSDENLGGVVYYRYKNLSIYDNLSLNFNQPEETSEQSVWKQSVDLKTLLEEESKMKAHNFTNRLSLSQEINDKSSIGGSYYVSTKNTKLLSNSVTEGKDVVRSLVDGKNNHFIQEATLKYASKLNSKGTALEVIGDWLNRQSDNNTNYLYGDDVSSVSKDESLLNMYKLSVDLTTPYNQKLIWKYGASVQYISSKYTPTVGAGDETRFPTGQIATHTKGLTPLAYVQAMGEFWKIRYSVGLNGQLNRIEYKTLDDGSESSDIQWGINPTVQLMVPLDKGNKHALMINYKRMLDDIPYAAISPVIRWADSYNYTMGNSELKAPTSDMLLAGASLFRNLLNVTVMYARLKDNIYWETKQSPNASDVFYTTPVNLPAINGYGAGVELNVNPIKYWRMKLSGRLELQQENAILGGINYDNTRLRQYYFMYNTFTLKHGWGGMLNLIFEPTYKTYDRTYYTVYNIGGQIYKRLCKDKLQLTLSFNALGDRRKYDRFANGSTVSYDYTTPVQSVGLSVIWRFSGGKRINVNAVESGFQNYKEIKDIR